MTGLPEDVRTDRPTADVTGYRADTADAQSAQAHVMRCSDGIYDVVKFQNNPQHRRILVNELLGTATTCKKTASRGRADCSAATAKRVAATGAAEGRVGERPECGNGAAVRRPRGTAAVATRVGAPGEVKSLASTVERIGLFRKSCGTPTWPRWRWTEARCGRRR